MSSTFPLPLAQPPTDVHLADVLNLWKKDVFLNLYCHHIGTVQSFDSAKQTATVSINYSRTQYQVDATGLNVPIAVAFPLLIDAPVICLGGGTTSLTFPIKAGDECLVLFNDRDIDNWFSGGSGSTLNTGRLHSSADALILVGVRSMANVLQNYDGTRATLNNGSTLVGVGPSLIKIANNMFTLNGLLQNLLTEVQNLVTQTAAITVTGVIPGGGVSGPPVNAAAITTIGTQIMSTANDIAQLLE